MKPPPPPPNDDLLQEESNPGGRRRHQRRQPWGGDQFRDAALGLLRSHPGVIALVAFFALLSVFSALNSTVAGVKWWMDAPLREKIAQKKRQHEFCRTVYESLTPTDTQCDPYLKAIAQEVQDEKKREAEEAKAREIAAAKAKDPYRELTSMEMTVCVMALKDAMKDPSSFRVNSKTRQGGGIVDFTATNGFGGPTRSRIHCLTGKNLNDE